MTIKIVTDSTSDIPKHLVDRHGIIVLPLTVHFGHEEFRDGVDITSDEFFKKLVSNQVLPTTSQIAPAVFKEVYERELKNGNSIISIHISSELSGTYQSAVIARETLKNDKNVSVIDSRSTTLSLGMMVLKAAELAESGLSYEQIVEEIEKYKREVKLLIVVDTLDYLRKGGRLSGAQAVLGNMLNIKPVLTIEDGKVVVIDKVRGDKKAQKRIIELLKEMSNDISGQAIGVANAACPETADEIKQLVKEEFGSTEFIEANVGSVIGTHVGPGAYGIVFS